MSIRAIVLSLSFVAASILTVGCDMEISEPYAPGQSDAGVPKVIVHGYTDAGALAPCALDNKATDATVQCFHSDAGVK